MTSTQQVCTICVMDRSDRDIDFDQDGVCHHCRQYIPVIKEMRNASNERRLKLDWITKEIKAQAAGSEYDCLLGVSGGVDSSYVAYLASHLELKPLIVHFDNGWNSELSVENINKLVDKLGFDLFTYVINWVEFKDLQRSFFKASVIDIEMLTDHAIIAAMYKIARDHKIKYILSGDNIATESGLPKGWVWNKADLINIKAIQKRFGTRKLETFPRFNLWQNSVNQLLKTFIMIKPLNYIDYQKSKAIETLSSELDWRYYGGKHFESIFTKFYQAYILPEKFGIDKRKAHFSSLIRNGEMTRNGALEELKKPLYDPIELRHDKAYVLKKLSFSEKEFESIMQLPVRSHLDYPSEVRRIRYLLPLRGLYRKLVS